MNSDAPNTRTQSMYYLLGAAFTWSGGHGFKSVASRDIRARSEAVTEWLTERSQDQMHRQKRPSVTYVDAMTSICEGEPAHLLKTDAFLLAAELALAVEKGIVPDHLYMDVVEFEPIRKLKQSFRYRLQDSTKPRLLPESIRSVESIETAAIGRDGLGKGNVRRHIEIPMEDDPNLTDWHLLSIYAVLAHLKCDLEVLLDMGFLPVRRCQRLRCGAFYRVKRMSGRPKYCSDTCRACAPREQAT